MRKNVATGMYIYELRTDKFVSVKKMLLIKIIVELIATRPAFYGTGLQYLKNGFKVL